MEKKNYQILDSSFVSQERDFGEWKEALAK